MKFVEMTGETLKLIVSDKEFRVDDLSVAGISNRTLVRVNEQGDIEVRRTDRWDVVGGLLGDYEQRLKQHTGLEWA